ncbi:hypothetical protein NQ315_011210 [Exocentrus adspersus]|uniref:Fatty acid synthase n=1 Tax=Exocentrus adspersus TaxID=1586481 RepID=A0AAV8VF61_9CUCU|nr:hypothetical protein NQ315_011210 [Exocentrus adspersus]
MVSKEVVISGLSGRYPECNNVEELADVLFNGVNPITDDERRFPRGVMGLPPWAGKIPELDKFDCTFFGIHSKQAKYMDPRHRILCETVYESIIDAGFNPQELRGSNTGVYVGISMFPNTEVVQACEDSNGYIALGISSGIAANRISYCFDFKGKSYSLDTACSTSLYGIVNAVQDIEDGKVDAAIVCAAQVLFHPYESSEYNKLNILAPDGKCKVFSKLRNGYVRSEAIVSLFLQKKKDCRRAYATIVGAMANIDGFKEEGIVFPSVDMQFKLMQGIYNNQTVNPDEIEYVELHGSGTQIGDFNELISVVNMFCKNRKTALPVGSVKSNLGHTETASGLCSVSKVIIAMESGIIPANLHADPLDTDLPGLKERKIQILTRNHYWSGGLAAINSFGFGGSNAHVVLKSNCLEKTKPIMKYKHRLVFASGRTTEAVNYFLDGVERNSDDDEFIALVDDIHKINCEGHRFRGYTILGEKLTREVSQYNRKRPVWFIYAGMGSQWLGMGQDLMRNETFRSSIMSCAKALKPYNINLEEILSNPKTNVFDDPTCCFSAITAIQVAMTDLLYSLHIMPDGIAGHSLGEVGCSYADGQITREEAVLLAYARGYASQCTKLPSGLMAAVGLSKEECLKILPDDIYVACQNGKSNTTISGPVDSVSDFLNNLRSKGIFAVKVNSGGLAYHSKYINDAVPFLYDFIKGILKNPKERSHKWISTSVAEDQKDKPWVQYNCAEYHANNFANVVLFDEVYKHVPENAIVIEVAPHGLLQSILRREFPSSVTVLSLGNRNTIYNEEWCLAAIGKMYLAGCQPNLKKLYKHISYPVSRGTKMLNSLVKWDHNTSWFVPLWNHKDSFGNIICVNISDAKYAYLTGHNIDGEIMMPGSGYIEFAWRTLASLHRKKMEELPVVIENVKFKRSTILTANTQVKFLVNIMKDSGQFEISEGGSIVCTGRIYTKEDVGAEYSKVNPSATVQNYLPLASKDIYKILRLKRHVYSGSFMGVRTCDVFGFHGMIRGTENFSSFIDSMIQLILMSTSKDLMLPVGIEKVVIEPQQHLNLVKEGQDLCAFFNQDSRVIRSGSIELFGIELSSIPHRKKVDEDLVLENYEFLPFENVILNEFDIDSWVYGIVQVIIQNNPGDIRIAELIGEDTLKLKERLKHVVAVEPMVKFEIIEYNIQKENIYNALILTEDALPLVNEERIYKCLVKDGFVLYQGDINKLNGYNLNTVLKATFKETGIYLLSPYRKFPDKYSIVNVSCSEFTWLEKIKELIKSNISETVYLVNKENGINGLVGLVKCLLCEYSRLSFRCVLIEDITADSFSIDNSYYSTQLNKNLVFNILRDGRWGTLVHKPLKLVKLMKETADAFVSVLRVGELSTLNWIQKSHFCMEDNSGSEKVYVYYSSLNMADILAINGKLYTNRKSFGTGIGLEYSGITDSGKKVMGLKRCGCLSLQLQNDPDLTWQVPNSLTLEEAATIPFVYAMCYYSLIIRGKVKLDDCILINDGMDQMGLSAIAIALSMGCRVFTTVRSEGEIDSLKKVYPELKEDNIGLSVTASFKNVIMAQTNGNGVDIIFTTSDQICIKSLMCLSNKGNILATQRVNFVEDIVDSRLIRKSISFHDNLLDELFSSDCEVKIHVCNLLYDGLRNGVVKPFPRTNFRAEMVGDAVKCLSLNKNIGKVLINIRDESSLLTRTHKRTINAVQKIAFDPCKSYIIIGGLGGVGLELADWLIERGATKIILNSRREICNGYESYCLKKWSTLEGVTVKINTDDTSSLKGAEDLVNFAKSLGHVGGVFNTALVLRDASIENQTMELFEAVLKPKVWCNQNMDIVTRAVCPELDHFVVCSSISCGRGTTGQSNYGMANSALEQLCEKRKREKLPALAIQWGPIGDVGYVAEKKSDNEVEIF